MTAPHQSLHFNTPVCHDSNAKPRISILLVPPVFELSHGSCCSLNYPPFHPTFSGNFPYGGTHPLTSVHCITPLYRPPSFFNVLGQHNLNFLLLSLQQLKAMPPRAEAWDECGENEDVSHDKTKEYRVPTPPWLGDPKPWLTPTPPAASRNIPIVAGRQNTKETRGRESLKIKINLQRLQTSHVPMDVDSLAAEEPRLKIRIAQQRLQLLRLAQGTKNPRV